MIRWICALSAGVALAMCGMESATAQTAAPPPLAAYGALPALEDVSISPDGETLAYVRHVGDRSEVIAQTRGGDVLVSIDTSDRRVRAVQWASNDHLLVASATTQYVPFFLGRQEMWVADIVNVRNRRVVRAMRDADHRAYNVIFRSSTGRHDGKPVLFVQALTDEQGMYALDLYRVDLDSGRGVREARAGTDTGSYYVRDDGSVAARTSYDTEGGLWRLSVPAGGGWRDIHRIRASIDTPGVWGFGRTSETILISELKDGDYRLMELSLGGSADQAPVDLGPAPTRIYHDADDRLIGVGFIETYQDYEFFDEKLSQAWTLLKQSFPGRQLSLGGYSDDLSRIVFHVEGAGQPGAYFLYDGASRNVSMIGRAYPAIPAVAEVRLVRYQAQDGMDLMGFLTLPPGRAARNLPLIMMPHGGPASRDYAGFDWWPQALASRGYAVFQPQFRGSDGFGVAHLEAGYGQWGRKMQSDVSDAIPVLAQSGVIDPARVCIVGASYGGYAALAGMTLEAGTYKCAVAVAGVSDLREMLLAEQRQGARGDANPAIRYWNRFMGATGPGDTSIDAYSPARLADKVEGPILLIHGRDDTTVPYDQSQLMARALGADARLVTLEGEDHYLSTAATRQRMLAETVAFLEANLPPQ